MSEVCIYIRDNIQTKPVDESRHLDVISSYEVSHWSDRNGPTHDFKKKNPRK